MDAQASSAQTRNRGLAEAGLCRDVNATAVSVRKYKAADPALGCRWRSSLQEHPARVPAGSRGSDVQVDGHPGPIARSMHEAAPAPTQGTVAARRSIAWADAVRAGPLAASWGEAIVRARRQRGTDGRQDTSQLGQGKGPSQGHTLYCVSATSSLVSVPPIVTPPAQPRCRQLPLPVLQHMCSEHQALMPIRICACSSVHRRVAL